MLATHININFAGRWQNLQSPDSALQLLLLFCPTMWLSGM